MFENLRLVVLDYPKLIIDNDEASRILSDMIQAKQINFERTDADYVPLSGLDMISTHFMIYEVSDIYNPKQILAIRNCYEDRANKHGISLPYESYIQHVPLAYQKRHAEFRKGKNNIVDCNAWYVDKDFSKKKTGLPLSEILWFMLVSHILQRGLSHFVATTNEKYKASRWVEPVGKFDKDMIYQHPKVPEDHLLLLCDSFNYEWYMSCWDKYGKLFKNRLEYKPSNELSGENLWGDEKLLQFAKSKLENLKLNIGESDTVVADPVAS